MSVLAILEVTSALRHLPRAESREYGGVVWDYIMPARVNLSVPLDRKDLGVRLPALREILGWSEGGTVRRMMEISTSQYERIVAALRQNLEEAKQG